MTKTCSRCQSAVNIEDFYLTERGRPQSICKPCVRASSSTYHHTHKGDSEYRTKRQVYHQMRMRGDSGYRSQRNARTAASTAAKIAGDPDWGTKRHRRWKYGLSPEGYRQMVENQVGKCKLCGCIPKKLRVDHDHITGVIRGLLCNKCNCAIGGLGDNEAGLLRALAYLRGVESVV